MSKTPLVVRVKRKCLLWIFSWERPYSTSCFTTCQFISGSPPKVYDAVEYLSGKLPDMERPKPIPEPLKEEVRARLSDVYESQDIEDALSDIQELIDNEELFTKDVYREYVTDFKNRKTPLQAAVCK